MKPIAFVFPGQGSQSVGMLDAWGDHPAVRETIAEASDALNEDIGALIAGGPKEDLALTTNTQPVMLVAGVACWRAWRAEGGALSAAVAGHSLGEYSALVAAEAVPVGTGAMAAILGLDASKVIAGCAEVTGAMGQNGTEVVEAVNFNDPVQTVIAGTKAAVDKACEVLKGMGAKRALPLPVSAPFHSSLMKPAAERLKGALEAVDFADPKIPVVNNIDVAIEDDHDRIRDALYRQAFGPVRWVECIHKIKAMGLHTVVECGPGKVLAGMTKRIDADLTGLAMYDPTSLAEVKAQVA